MAVAPERGDTSVVIGRAALAAVALAAVGLVTAPHAHAARAAATARAVDHAHLRVAWQPVRGASSYRVWRGPLLVGTTSGHTFTDTLLWPATRYEYRIVARNANGRVLATRRVAAATALLPRTGFPRPFSPTSFWNTPIGPNRATHPRNDALIRYLRSKIRHPNLSVGEWAVSVAEVRAGDPVHAVPCTKYRCTLGAFGPFPIPFTAMPNPSDDGHLAVYDPVTQREWDFWQAKRTSGGWSASAGAAVSMRGDGVAPPRTGAGNAANFPLLGGLVRPEEILQGRIEHALVFGLPGIGKGPPVCPASHNAATTSHPDALREGQLLQLDPSLDVDALPVPGWQKTLMRAMQKYGMYLRDNSGAFAIYAESPNSRGYDAWSHVGLRGDYQPLRGMPWERFRVIAAPDYPNC